MSSEAPLAGLVAAAANQLYKLEVSKARHRTQGLTSRRKGSNLFEVLWTQTGSGGGNAMFNSSVLDVAIGLIFVYLAVGADVHHGERVARAAFQYPRRDAKRGNSPAAARPAGRDVPDPARRISMWRRCEEIQSSRMTSSRRRLGRSTLPCNPIWINLQNGPYGKPGRATSSRFGDGNGGQTQRGLEPARAESKDRR